MQQLTYEVPYWDAYTKDENTQFKKNELYNGGIVKTLYLISTFCPCLRDDADVTDVDILTYLPISRKKIRSSGYNRSVIDGATKMCWLIGDDAITRNPASLSRQTSVSLIRNNFYRINNCACLMSPSDSPIIDHSGRIIIDEKGIAYECMRTIDMNIEYKELIHPHGWKKVAHTWNHILLLSNDGNLYTKGPNRYGQCGCRRPARLDHLKCVSLSHLGKNVKVRDICTGEYISGIVLTDGRVAVCGSGYYGQLGLGDNKCRKHFTIVPNITNAIAIVSGNNHFMVLLRSGLVLSWATSKIVNVHSNGYELGREAENEKSRSTPQYVSLPCPAIEVSAGYGTTMILLMDGSVVALGNFGKFGKFSHANPLWMRDIDAISVSCAIRFGMILCRNDAIKCIGNEYTFATEFPCNCSIPADPADPTDPADPADPADIVLGSFIKCPFVNSNK